MFCYCHFFSRVTIQGQYIWTNKRYFMWYTCMAFLECIYYINSNYFVLSLFFSCQLFQPCHSVCDFQSPVSPVHSSMTCNLSHPIRPPFLCPCLPHPSDWTRNSQESEADDENEEDTPPPTLQRVGAYGDTLELTDHVDEAFSNFARTSARRSLANNVAMVKWLDAQEKAQDNYEVCLPYEETNYTKLRLSCIRYAFYCREGDAIAPAFGEICVDV